MSSWFFVPRLTLGILFLQLVVDSLFRGDYASFQLIFQSLVATSRSCRAFFYSYQLHCPFPGLFGAVLSFKRSSNLVAAVICGCHDVRFFNQYLCRPSFPGGFQLGIILHCIFIISWLISTFFLLFTFSNCFLQPFNHSAVIFYSYPPDITPKFDTIFIIPDNSVTKLFSVQFFVDLFLLEMK